MHTETLHMLCLHVFFTIFSSMLMMIYPRTGNPHNNNLIVPQKKMWHDIACKYFLCSFNKIIVRKKNISCYQLLCCLPSILLHRLFLPLKMPGICTCFFAMSTLLSTSTSYTLSTWYDSVKWYLANFLFSHANH